GASEYLRSRAMGRDTQPRPRCRSRWCSSARHRRRSSSAGRVARESMTTRSLSPLPWRTVSWSRYGGGARAGERGCSSVGGGGWVAFARAARENRLFGPGGHTRAGGRVSGWSNAALGFGAVALACAAAVAIPPPLAGKPWWEYDDPAEAQKALAAGASLAQLL